MKKKIVLALTLVFAFVCIFAISVSAQDRTSISYTDFEGVTHNVPVVKYPDVTRETVKAEIDSADNLNIGNVSGMMDDGAYTIVKATDGTLTAYPTWYLIEPISGENAISEIRYGYLNAVSGKTYERGAIVYIEFPEGMSYVRNNSVFGLKNGSNPYETNVTEFVIPSSVNSIQTESFRSMPYLKKVWIKEGNGITDIPNGTFSGSKNLEYVQFENLTKLEAIGGLTSCNLMGEVDLSKTNLKTIRNTCFQYNLNMGKITLPDTVETIEDGAFQNTGNAYLSSSYLPKNLKSVGKWFFAYNTNLLETYIFPEGVTSLDNEPFQDSKVAGGPTGKELNLVFLGEVTGVVYLNGNGHQKHAEKVTVYFAQNSLSDYNTNGFYIKPSGSSTTSVPGAIRAAFCEGTYKSVDGTITGIEYIYITNTNGTSYTEDMVNDATNGFDFANHTHFGPRFIKQALTCGDDGIDTVTCIICDTDQDKITPATGDHKWTSDNNCATDDVCRVCNDVIIEAIAHSYLNELLYPNGYAVVGINRNTCQNDGCTHVEEAELAALFVSKGYSKDETSNAIVLDTTVNKNAIIAYESYLKLTNTEATITYGVAVAIADFDDNTANDKLFDANGETKAGAISIKLHNANYSNVQVKITGIGKDNYDTAVHCCGYISVNGVISYINGEKTESFAGKVTYNSIPNQ